MKHRKKMNQYIKATMFAFALFLFAVSAIAQDMEMPLQSNPAIKSYLESHKNSGAAGNARISGVGDTLSLPFIDDFSYDGVYPSAALWVDSDVFINRDFPVDP